MSIQDPRERPVEAAAAAAESHRRFADRDSDLAAWVTLWGYLQEQQKTLGSSQFRRMCQREYLNHLRIREWQDIYAQLRQVARPLGLRPNTEPAAPAQVHQALLAGLLSQIGVREGERTDYLGARNARFAVFPGSTLAKKPPRWVMAAELVETSRLWARGVARIEPEWAERLGAHLLVRHYSEPHWDVGRGAAMVWERATLYGVPVVARRRTPFERIDAEGARDFFLRCALVDGEGGPTLEVLADNRALVDEIRARRRDVAVSEETLFDFYDQRVPSDVASTRRFDSWWGKERQRRGALLTLRPEDVVPPETDDGLDPEIYPDVWWQDGLDLAVTYQFEPGSTRDGVSIHIPLAVLNQVRPDGFDWQVPALREELVTGVIRSLPKEVRRAFVPVPDYVAAFLDRAGPGDGPLLGTLRRILPSLTGDPLPAGSWRLDRVPDHLKVTFVVEAMDGTSLAASKHLEALQDRLAPLVRRVVADAVDIKEVSGQTSWTFGDIPVAVTGDVAGRKVRGFPSLVDEGTAVGLRVHTSAAGTGPAMWTGTRRLLLLNLPPVGRRLQARLTNATRLALATAPHRSSGALWDDCVLASVDHLLAVHGGPVRDLPAWMELLERVRDDLEPTMLEVVNRVGDALAATGRLEAATANLGAPALEASLLDMATQVGGLIYPGFVAATGVDRLDDVVRYLHGAERRLTALGGDVPRDRARMARVRALEDAYRKTDAAVSGRRGSQELRWLLEELRVSLFAQALGTRTPVSEDRIARAIEALRAGAPG